MTSPNQRAALLQPIIVSGRPCSDYNVHLFTTDAYKTYYPSREYIELNRRIKINEFHSVEEDQSYYYIPNYVGLRGYTKRSFIVSF